MKKSKLGESQIVAILEEGEAGVPVAQILRNHGISQATYCVWKSRYGGASVADLRRLKELEADNSEFKRMHADHVLESAAIKVSGRKPWRRRWKGTDFRFRAGAPCREEVSPR